jgi:hypothetical protein
MSYNTVIYCAASVVVATLRTEQSYGASQRCSAGLKMCQLYAYLLNWAEVLMLSFSNYPLVTGHKGWEFFF